MTVDRGGISELAGSHLLIATGRRPNTDDLGLDRAAVKRDERGYVVVDDEPVLRSLASGRWATATAKARSPTHRGMITKYRRQSVRWREQGG